MQTAILELFAAATGTKSVSANPSQWVSVGFIVLKFGFGLSLFRLLSIGKVVVAAGHNRVSDAMRSGWLDAKSLRSAELRPAAQAAIASSANHTVRLPR